MFLEYMNSRKENKKKNLFVIFDLKKIINKNKKNETQKKNLEPNPSVWSISVGKKNKFEREKNFEDKRNEFEKIMQNVYNQRNYL